MHHRCIYVGHTLAWEQVPVFHHFRQQFALVNWNDMNWMENTNWRFDQESSGVSKILHSNSQICAGLASEGEGLKFLIHRMLSSKSICKGSKWPQNYLSWYNQYFETSDNPITRVKNLFSRWPQRRPITRSELVWKAGTGNEESETRSRPARLRIKEQLAPQVSSWLAPLLPSAPASSRETLNYQWPLPIEALLPYASPPDTGAP